MLRLFLFKDEIMPRLLFTLALAIVALPTWAVAQQPVSPTARPSFSPSVSKSTEVTGTPEMWFYEQERLRYEDPNTVARARAEYEANQRQARLAALKWYGMSNSRPQAGTDAHNSAPKWTGNMAFGNDWSVVSPAPTFPNFGGIPVTTRSYRNW
jgi:hypothetical protein